MSRVAFCGCPIIPSSMLRKLAQLPDFSDTERDALLRSAEAGAFVRGERSGVRFASLASVVSSPGEKHRDIFDAGGKPSCTPMPPTRPSARWSTGSWRPFPPPDRPYRTYSAAAAVARSSVRIASTFFFASPKSMRVLSR